MKTMLLIVGVNRLGLEYRAVDFRFQILRKLYCEKYYDILVFSIGPKVKSELWKFVSFDVRQYAREISHITLYGYNAPLLLLFAVLGKCLGKELSYHYVEKRSTWTNKSLLTSVNNYLIEEVLVRLVDTVYPISRYLVRDLQRINKDYVYIPAVINQSFFPLNIHPEEKNVFYIGSKDYWMEVLPIVKFFNLRRDLKLDILINGLDEQIKQMYSSPFVSFLDEMSEELLEDRLNRAYCTLLPLDNTLKNIARYPNKVTQYLAFNGLIVTNPVGDLEEDLQGNYLECDTQFNWYDRILVMSDETRSVYREKSRQLISEYYNIDNWKL